MRSVSLVEHIEFDFTGPVLRNGLTLGDVDNDGHQELVVGNEDGDVSIFKGTECWQTLSGLGFIACVVIGDILNIKQNCLVIVSADGWCHIYYSHKKHVTIIDETNTIVPDTETVDGQASSSVRIDAEVEEDTAKDVILDERGLLECVHKQRIPPNTKVAILGDVDGDGVIELVLGLTDRVVRSYRWVDSQNNCDSTNENLQTTVTFDNIQGKLVGLNKWECANQIGSVTLHHAADGSPCLLVAQPGGTFMRIKCQPEGISEQIIENFDASESNSVRSESFAASFVDYQFLGLSRMRNQNISTEILGDLNTTNDSRKPTLTTQPSTSKQADNDTCKSKGKPYAVATLDGTIMLVQDEIILWAIQVDHQPFALEKLDVTGNGSDDIIVCSWDGQTYILDQEKNSVAFHLDEPVKAFCCGYYTVTPEVKPVPSLVYVTFWNKIYLFYDIKIPSMTVKRFNPDFSKLEGISQLVQKIDLSEDEIPDNLGRRSKKQIVEYLLYGVKFE